MASGLNAEIIAIGTEILLGELTDTNSVYLARGLRDLGINLFYMTSVGDNETRIENAIRLALSRAQIVITCGGLGPTVDDMTRQSVAKATDRGLTFHQSLLDAIAARFSGFRVQMTENNRRQAYVPDNAIIIENPVGTAPAFAVEQDDKVIISLPGVPREMKYLWTEKVIPYLRQRYGITTTIIKARNFKTAGIGESTLDDMLGDELLNASNPTIGLAAHAGVIDIRITAKADTTEQADAMIAEFEKQVKDRVGKYIFGSDDQTIEGAMLDALKANAKTIAVIEAGVASIVGERLAGADTNIVKALHRFDTVASAEHFTVDLTNDVRQIAERLAATVAEQAGADVGLAIVSLSDSEEDRADTEEVSAAAVVYGDNKRSRSYGLGGKSETARTWTGTWAMSQVWRLIKESATE